MCKSALVEGWTIYAGQWEKGLTARISEVATEEFPCGLNLPCAGDNHDVRVGSCCDGVED